MKMQGIGASTGVVMAKVLKLEPTVIEISGAKIAQGALAKEVAAVKKAIAETSKQIEALRNKAQSTLGEEEARIFDAHIQVAADPSLVEEINNLITNERINALAATDRATKQFAAIFEQMDDEYMRERAADVRDVARRILLILANKKDVDLTAIKEKVVLVSDDLTPSQTAQLDTKFVRGFLTNIGGRTSHASIMARSLEIPAVVGLKDVLSKLENGDLVAFDGATGEVLIRPTSAEQKAFTERVALVAKEKAADAAYYGKKTLSSDGEKMEIAANIGSPKDVEAVLKNDGEAIGLFRSEFLYMDAKNWPTEDEQYEAYSAVLKGMKNKVVTVRTLDIGGDKQLSYFQFPQEMNPFLGYRAIRFSLDRKDVFRTQLRALIRASVHGRLAIMFPMIATVDEFVAAKKEYEKTYAELVSEKVKVSKNILVGMMVEIPAAAVLAEQFAMHADFLSIGTNDLMQYTFAADRMSEKVAYLYQPLNPSILNMINLTIKGGHAHKKLVAMCGEMAGDPSAIPLLVGMGLDEFSMSATSMLAARRQIAGLSALDAKKLVAKALKASTQKEVGELVDAFNKAQAKKALTK